MTLPLMFIIFWIFIITWLAYRWSWENESEKIVSPRKGNLTKKLKNRKSTTSIESLDMSENEDLPKCHKRKIKQQAKTRWPSRTSIND